MQNNFSSQKPLKYLLNTVLLILTLIISISLFQLKSPPSTLPSGFEISLFLLFYIIVSLYLYLTKVNISPKLAVVFIFFSLAFASAIISALPSPLPIQESVEMLEKHTNAITQGIQLGDQIRTNSKDTDVAQQELNNKLIDSESVDIGQQSLSLSAAGEDRDKISEQLSQTVPLGYKNWLCNANGCGFIDDQTVWTIAAKQRLFAFFLSLLSLTSLVLLLPGNLPLKLDFFPRR